MPRKKKTKLVSRDFTFPNHADPNRQIPGGGPYLDDLAREKAETLRAKGEGREPDYDNPGSDQSTPLQPTSKVKSERPGDYVVDVDVTLEVAEGE